MLSSWTLARDYIIREGCPVSSHRARTAGHSQPVSVTEEQPRLKLKSSRREQGYVLAQLLPVELVPKCMVLSLIVLVQSMLIPERKASLTEGCFM